MGRKSRKLAFIFPESFAYQSYFPFPLACLTKSAIPWKGFASSREERRGMLKKRRSYSSALNFQVSENCVIQFETLGALIRLVQIGRHCVCLREFSFLRIVCSVVACLIKSNRAEAFNSFIPPVSIASASQLVKSFIQAAWELIRIKLQTTFGVAE